MEYITDDLIDETHFGQAAADVLGLPSAKLVLGSKIESEGGLMVLSAAFVLEAEDIARIGQRVAELQKNNT